MSFVSKAAKLEYLHGITAVFCPLKARAEFGLEPPEGKRSRSSLEQTACKSICSSALTELIKFLGLCVGLQLIFELFYPGRIMAQWV